MSCSDILDVEKAHVVGESKMLHIVILHLVILSTSICGLQVHHKGEEEWRGWIPTKPWVSCITANPCTGPNSVIWSEAIEQKLENIVFPYAQRENEWHLVTWNCHYPWDSLILHFADGETEGLRLGDVQQVMWWFGDNWDENSNFPLSDVIVWGREWRGERMEKKEGVGRFIKNPRQDLNI